MVQAVIFDMDGVIIDSEPFHWEVNKKIFKELGIAVSEQEYQNYIGVSNTNMWTDLKRRHNLAQPVEKLVGLQVRGNKDFMTYERFEPVSGIIELIAQLKAADIRCAVASSSPYDIIDMVLTAFAIKGRFSIVVSGEDFAKGKPAPDIFLKAATLLGVLPADCVVIEDAAHGVAAAKAAGMRCAGFANKNSGNQDLSKADLIVERIADLSVGVISAL